jgi:hypothetical protein
MGDPQCWLPQGWPLLSALSGAGLALQVSVRRPRRVDVRKRRNSVQRNTSAGRRRPAGALGAKETANFKLTGRSVIVPMMCCRAPPTRQTHDFAI